MSRTARIILTFVVVVVLFDALGAAASRALHFEYGALSVGSWLIYAAAGFFGAERGKWGPGLLTGAVTGLADATLGWAVSWAIGPGRPAGGWQPGLLAIAAVSVIVVATVVSAIGAGVRQFVGPRGDRPGVQPSPPT